MRRLLLLMTTVVGLMMIIGCRSCSTPSEPSRSDGDASTANACTEPENPFDEGSGHYAGYDWAERTGSGTCGGNSQSFIEGCEEYQRQEDEYEKCEANK
jgi:hypothetical protein